MKKIVLLKGCAGLGNRIFTLINAVEYAKKTNRKLIIDWNDGLYFPMTYNFFNDFFTLKDIEYTAPHQKEIAKFFSDKNYTFIPKSFKEKPEQDIYHTFINAGNSFAQKIQSKFPKVIFLNRIGSNWIHNKYLKSNNSNFFVYLKNLCLGPSFPLGEKLRKIYEEDVVIYADFIPDVHHETIQKYFSISSEMEKIIEQYSNEFSISECIGVHVRSTDLKPTKDVNNLVSILQKKHSDQPIFLATDNANVETLFKTNFSDVRMLKKDIISESNRGIHHTHIDTRRFSNEKDLLTDALSDMILLSKTNFLFYQGNSSFSSFSAKLRSLKNTQNWLKLD